MKLKVEVQVQVLQSGLEIEAALEVAMSCRTCMAPPSERASTGSGSAYSSAPGTMRVRSSEIFITGLATGYEWYAPLRTAQSSLLAAVTCAGTSLPP